MPPTTLWTLEKPFAEVRKFATIALRTATSLSQNSDGRQVDGIEQHAAP